MLKYPLGSVSSTLSCLDKTIRKTCKSQFHEAAVYDLSIVEQNRLPGFCFCKNNAK